MSDNNIEKTLIAIPCMNTVHTEFMTSLLALRKPPGTDLSVSIASLIYDSRNTFAARAIREGYAYVLFIDSDMVFPPDMLTALLEDVKEYGCDFVASLFTNRQYPVKPMVYDRMDVLQDDDGPRTDVHTYYDYPRDAVFPIAGSGFGAVLVTTQLLKSVWDRYGPPFTPTPLMGEDFSFCIRANAIGANLYCDSRIKVGHIGYQTFNEQTYLASGGKAEDTSTTESRTTEESR